MSYYSSRVVSVLSCMIRTIAVASVLALCAGAAAAQTRPEPEAKSNLNVPQLFATTCGWCHTDGGRRPGKGPQLMNTKRSDDFIRYRIKHGKEGAMPAFGSQFSDADINAIIAYIRALKPD
jgi:mono/diheme cytochrome c family protein